MKDTDKVAIREKDGQGPIQDFLAAEAKRHKVWIVGGSVPWRRRAPTRSATLPRLRRRGQARGPLRPRSTSSASTWGRRSTPRSVHRAGAAVSRSSRLMASWASRVLRLRFPELYRAMGEVDFIFVPSAFTKRRARRTGTARCAPAPSRTSATWWRRRRAATRERARDPRPHHDRGPVGVVLDRLPRGSGLWCRREPTYQAKIRRSLPALKHRTIKS